MRSVCFITTTHEGGFIDRSRGYRPRLTRRNRRFSGSFLHFDVFAVDAVGVFYELLRQLLAGLMTDEAGTRAIPMPPRTSRRDLVKVHGVTIWLVPHSAP